VAEIHFIDNLFYRLISIDPPSVPLSSKPSLSYTDPDKAQPLLLILHTMQDTLKVVDCCSVFPLFLGRIHELGFLSFSP
jgi:hypothetical protein